MEFGPQAIQIGSIQIRYYGLIIVAAILIAATLAARIANSVTDAFIALNLERRMDSSSYAKTFLETQLGLTKARLEESERKLNEYARSKNILTLDEKTNVLNQTFTEYSTALTKAEQEVIKTESDYEAIKTAPNTARQVLESVTIQNYKDLLSKLDQTYQETAKVFEAAEKIAEKAGDTEAWHLKGEVLWVGKGDAAGWSSSRGRMRYGPC